MSSVDQLVVTGSKDGQAVVWELDPWLDAFRLKVLLVSTDGAVAANKRERINAVICFIEDPGSPRWTQIGIR